jgi:hypothetical protein
MTIDGLGMTNGKNAREKLEMKAIGRSVEGPCNSVEPGPTGV